MECFYTCTWSLKTKMVFREDCIGTCIVSRQKSTQRPSLCGESSRSRQAYPTSDSLWVQLTTANKVHPIIRFKKKIRGVKNRLLLVTKVRFRFGKHTKCALCEYIYSCFFFVTPKIQVFAPPPFGLIFGKFLKFLIFPHFDYIFYMCSTGFFYSTIYK